MVDWTKLDIDKLNQKIEFKQSLIPHFEEHLAEALAMEEWAITEVAITNSKLTNKLLRKKKKRLKDFIRTTPIIEKDNKGQEFEVEKSADIVSLEQKLIDIKKDIKLLNDDGVRFCKANIDKCKENIAELKTINKSTDDSKLKESNKIKINDLEFKIKKFMKLINKYKVLGNE